MTVALRRVWAEDLDADLDAALRYELLKLRVEVFVVGQACYLANMDAQHGFIRDGDDFIEDGIPRVPMLRPDRPPPPQAVTRPASSAGGPGSGVEARL